MTLDKILILIGGLSLSGLVAWFFWFSKKQAVQIQTDVSGIQEALIKVKGGYTPNILAFKAGVPIRLNFLREETASCSEEVIFSDFNKSAILTPFKTIPVELTIDKPGEYGFQCAMGMIHGKLIIE